MKKKILILKNDRTGDLFVSLKAINRILNKHYDDNVQIILSDVNHKFSFLFPDISKKIISMNISLYEKIGFFFYLLRNKIDTIYILTPKNFYYYLPLLFRRIKFYGITIKGVKNRPDKYLIKYLYKYIEINRLNITKRKSSYEIQKELIEKTSEKDLIKNTSKVTHDFTYPKNYVFFHYKQNLFNNLLGWDLQTMIKLLEFLSENFENVLFSSEINNHKVNNFFSSNLNTYDFSNNKKKFFNNKNIFFLKDIDGYNLFDAVKKSTQIISPEGIITHMGYYLKKPILALMHFNLNNRRDFINQIISCKEWFPPDNYKFIVLKKDFDKSISKLKKRI